MTNPIQTIETLAADLAAININTNGENTMTDTNDTNEDVKIDATTNPGDNRTPAQIKADDKRAEAAAKKLAKAEEALAKAVAKREAEAKAIRIRDEKVNAERAEKAIAYQSKQAERLANAGLKQKTEKPAKVEAANIDGFVLADDANADFIASETEAASVALDLITSKDLDTVVAYLALGKFQSDVSPMFKSVKIYGQYVAAKLPASAALDPALRSNCKWLYEAISGKNDAGDILTVLEVNRIEDYKSGNPTVIRRNYKAAVDDAAAKAAAEEAGTSVEELSKAEKEAAKAEKDAAWKLALAGIVAYVEPFKLSKANTAKLAGDLTIILGNKPTENIAFFQSFAHQDDDSEE